VAEIGQGMKFPPVPSEPLLLGCSEILEGEIHRKVTKKTSTTKKESRKEKPDQKEQA
jgi:hypothetical protein